MQNCKIVRIAGLHYLAPVIALYGEYPELRSAAYLEQQELLFQNVYAYSNSFAKSMQALGYDAHEIIYDLEILQKSWARENGAEYTAKNWQHAIVLSQIKMLKPEVIYFQDIASLPYAIISNLKTIFPFIKLIIIFRGYPGNLNDIVIQTLSAADILLGGSPVVVEKCKRMGLNPYLLYHGFDESILGKLRVYGKKNHQPQYDFSFVGSSGYGYGYGHHSRYWELLELIKHTDIELWLYEPTIKRPYLLRVDFNLRYLVAAFLNLFSIETLNRVSARNFIPSKIKNVINGIVKNKKKQLENKAIKPPAAPINKLFPTRCHAAVHGIDMYEILRQSKVTYNRHSNAASGTVDNLRLFQATGVGTCLLTDTGVNLPDLFEPEREVVTYNSVAECIEKVKYLLQHENLRQQIAQAGQRRTLRDHTILSRCQQIDEIIQRMF